MHLHQISRYKVSSRPALKNKQPVSSNSDHKAYNLGKCPHIETKIQNSRHLFLLKLHNLNDSQFQHVETSELHPSTPDFTFFSILHNSFFHIDYIFLQHVGLPYAPFSSDSRRGTLGLKEDIIHTNFLLLFLPLLIQISIIHVRLSSLWDGGGVFFIFTLLYNVLTTCAPGPLGIDFYIFFLVFFN